MSTSQRWAPVGAGIVTAVVGWTSSFAVVLAGLGAVGATSAQAASGLLVLCLTMGLGSVYLSLRTRLPITLAWSTPGAALLVGTGGVTGGWSAAVGAFVATGLLVLLTAVWPFLGDLVARIPASLAQAMLAGVLLTICLEPVRAVVAAPLLIAPVIVVWLALLRFASRWAVPGAFLVVVAVVLAGGGGAGTALPRLTWTAPSWSSQAMVGLAVPLFLVTMAAQNVPGAAVLRSFGFEVPWRRSMAVTAVGTVVGAPAGGHVINLAAISAALSASDEAGADRNRRWIAATTAGWSYVVLGCASASLVGLVAGAPAGLVATAAGLALVPTLASCLAAALTDPAERLPAAVTVLVGGSGIALVGVGPAFWSLAAGLTCRAVLTYRGPALRRLPRHIRPT